MANTFFNTIKTFINRLVDVISQGNLERIKILNEFNRVFNEAYCAGETDKLCKVTTAIGNTAFRHELSSFYLRSGFKITIENDKNIKRSDLVEITKYVTDSLPFVRQLMALGYDTLIVHGKNSRRRAEICLKDIADLKAYMLN